MNSKELVLIILGSDSDKEYGLQCRKTLQKLGINAALRIASAHRTPVEAANLVTSASDKGYLVIVAIAGLAAHLPGVCAAHTALPVIGLPVATGPMNGLDALFSTVMMPPGVPVAGVTAGMAGAKNAAILSARIIALVNNDVKKLLEDFTAEQRLAVVAKDKALQELL